MSKIESTLKQIPNEIRQIPKILSDDTRFAIIITLLKEGEMSFSELRKALGIKRNLLSHHLRILSQAAFIENYYEKKAFTPDYSFYDTTDLCKDVLENLFGIIEPKVSPTDMLTQVYSSKKNYEDELLPVLDKFIKCFAQEDKLNSIVYIDEDLQKNISEKLIVLGGPNILDYKKDYTNFEQKRWIEQWK